jgi:hypothetical protein
MLMASASLLGVVVLAGIGLAGLALLRDPTAAGSGWPGALHGLGGGGGALLLVVALTRTSPTPHAVRMGAAAFGTISASLICAALAIGLVILFRQLRQRATALTLIAAHGVMAIAGYTLLVTYISLLH